MEYAKSSYMASVDKDKLARTLTIRVRLKHARNMRAEEIALMENDAISVMILKFVGISLNKSAIGGNIALIVMFIKAAQTLTWAFVI